MKIVLTTIKLINKKKLLLIMDDKVTKRVIFPNIETGGVVLMIPAPQCELTLEQIIAKDVPSNVSHQVLDVTDIPEDHTYFDAWTYEEN